MPEITASLPMIDQTRCHNNAAKTDTKYICRLMVIIAIIICFANTLIIILVSYSNHNQEATTLVCMKCSKLKRLIDRWAWKSTVQQHGEECCFGEESDLLESMKYYFEKKMAGDKNDIERLQNRVNGLMFRIMENDTVNGTLDPPVDFSRLIDLMTQVFHRQRSILHLVSSKIVYTKKEPLTIYWDNMVKQGNISYNATGHSVTVHTTALYYIAIHVKFRATNTASNLTEHTTIQFYLKKIVQNHPIDVETYKKDCVFHNEMVEHDSYVHTITKLDYGDELFIEVPSSQRKFLATNAGSHRVVIFELS